MITTKQLLLIQCHLSEAPIVFTKELTDVECFEKDTVELVCETSKPNAEVKWFKNGDEIVSGFRYKINGEGCERRLTMLNCVLTDMLTYTCKIVRSEVATKGKLIVKGTPTCTHTQSGPVDVISSI